MSQKAKRGIKNSFRNRLGHYLHSVRGGTRGEFYMMKREMSTRGEGVCPGPVG